MSLLQLENPIFCKVQHWKRASRFPPFNLPQKQPLKASIHEMACDMRHKFFKAYCTALIDRGSYFAPTRKRKKKELKIGMAAVGFEPTPPKRLVP